MEFRKAKEHIPTFKVFKMTYNITLIPGDGVGPDVILSAVKCIEASGIKVRWEVATAGEFAKRKYGHELPKRTLDLIKKNKVALKGPITTPVGTGFRSVNVQLRQALELFANVRPIKQFPGVHSKYDNVDIVIIRENLEDLYSGIEFPKGKFKGLPKDSAVSLKIISEKNTKRIAQFAFDYALKNKRNKITCVHKANILKETDGLFLRISKNVAKKFPSIKFEDRIVDNMAMQLVIKPAEYDILLCPNLYGDILSDLCAGLTGSLGLIPSANYGKQIAIFEPTHGSVPKYAGKNKVNPSGAILAGVLLLRHIGENKAANKIEKAVISVIKEAKNVTYDLAKKNPVGTKQMTEAIIEKI